VRDTTSDYQPVIDEICGFNWNTLKESEITAAAWAYYYFSVQFRENLQLVSALHPDDPSVQALMREECDTDNLSPWPHVAAPNEKMNHDEFMRRTLELSPIEDRVRAIIVQAGERYLRNVRSIDDAIRAMSIASYEDGGLEAVFKAMLKVRHWDSPLLKAFRHFLTKHIGFDSDPEQGHGAMIRHLAPDYRIRRLWVEFRDLLLAAVPGLII